MSKPRIIIHLEGGLVQDVRGEGLPCEIEVEVRDYDVEGSDEETARDDEGREYIAGTWEV